MILQLKDVRLSFPSLWEPRTYQDGQSGKYKATFLIRKDDPQNEVIRKTIVNLATREWKEKTKTFLESFKENAQKNCYRDGDLSMRDEYAECMFLTATSPTRPTVIDRNRNILSQSDGRPYAGCYVNASVEIWIQTKTHAGIRCGLRGVQFLRDGESFTAGSIANSSEFDIFTEDSDSYLQDFAEIA